MSSDLQSLGRLLLVMGLVLAGIGAFLSFSPRLGWFGRLPGDISIQRDHVSFYFPLASCLLASAVISVVWWLISRWR